MSEKAEKCSKWAEQRRPRPYLTRRARTEPSRSYAIRRAGAAPGAGRRRAGLGRAPVPVARDAGRAVCRKRLWRRMEAERERAEGPRRPGVSGPGALPAAGRCSQRAVRGGSVFAFPSGSPAAMAGVLRVPEAVCVGNRVPFAPLRFPLCHRCPGWAGGLARTSSLVRVSAGRTPLLRPRERWVSLQEILAVSRSAAFYYLLRFVPSLCVLPFEVEL